MIFGEAIQAVAEITARTDNVAQIRYFINQVIHAIASRSMYPQSLSEVIFTPDDGVASLTFTIPLPERFNVVGYVTPFPEIGCELRPLKAPRSSLNTESGYYVTGDSLIVRSSREMTATYIGWHTRPAPLVNLEDTNWILERMEPQVIDMTIAKLRAATGDAEAGNRLLTFTTGWVDQQIRMAVDPYAK